MAPLPARADVDANAMRLNPELRQALASLRVSNLEVTAARAAYLPDLALNSTYGIDAVQFAVNGISRWPVAQPGLLPRRHA